MFTYRCFCMSLFLLMLVGCQSTSKSETDFIIRGKAKGVFNGVRAYLKVSENGQKGRVTDTAIVSNESFFFKGGIQSPEMRILSIDGIAGQTALVLEPGDTEVIIYKDSIYKSEIIGGENNIIFNAYKKGYQTLVDKMTALRTDYIAVRDNPQAVEVLQKQNNILRAEIRVYGLNFLLQNPNSDFSLMLLDGITGQKGFDAKLAKKVFDAIPFELLNKPTNVLVAQQVNLKITNALNVIRLELGVKAPDFTAPNPQGEMLTLSKILGEVTILDFWASWCKPCRLENPNFVKIYEKYQDKGLEIISISLDRKDQKSAWVSAIAKDKLSWYNVSNLKFWQDPVAQLYNISSIPATFILDREGKILATRLRGTALETKIAELLEN